MDIFRKFFVFLRMIRQAYRGLPIWGFVWVTRHCRQGCSHCYVWNNKTLDMTWETFETTIQKFQELGIAYVSIFGGEPNEHPQLLEMIGQVNKQGLTVYVNSDITAYPVERLEEIAGVLSRNPNNVLSFSLDTAVFKRGNKRSMEAIKERLDMLTLLVEQGTRVKLHCNLTFTTDTIGQWLTLIDFLQSFPKLHIGISVRGAYYPFTPVPQSVRTLESSHKEVKNMCDELESLKRAGKPVINTFGFLQRFPLFVKSQIKWDCGTQRDVISIDCDGRLMHCSYQPVNGLLPSFQFPSAHISELDIKKLNELRQASEQILKHCNSQCFSPAYCCTSDYRSWWEWLWLALRFLSK